MEQAHRSAHEREDPFFGAWHGNTEPADPQDFTAMHAEHPDEEDHYRAYETGEHQPHGLGAHLLNDHGYTPQAVEESWKGYDPDEPRDPSLGFHRLREMHRQAHDYEHDVYGVNPWRSQ
jgi:hypothetical protein